MVIMKEQNISKQLEIKKKRLEMYYHREEKMLTDGVQSYGIGSRNLSRYQTDLAKIQEMIEKLEEDIKELEGRKDKQRPRKAYGVVPMNW